MKHSWLCAPLCAAALMAGTGEAAATISIQLRPSAPSINVGNTVGFGVYALSDSTSNQAFAAIQVMFTWPPAFLQMLSNSNAGAVSLLSSSFPSPDPYGLNESTLPHDGNAMWVGYSPFGSSIAATPAGTLLTTLRFTGLAQTSSAMVSLLVSGGNPVGRTQVFDGTVPNLDVTGSLTGGTVQIVPAPAILVTLAGAGVTALCRRRRS